VTVYLSQSNKDSALIRNWIVGELFKNVQMQGAQKECASGNCQTLEADKGRGYCR
jgi:hypothetical protein